MSEDRTTVSHEYAPPPVVKRKESAGCFLYSCLTVICVMVVFTGAIYWGAKTLVDNIAGEYGELEPKTFPPLEISQVEKHQLQEKLNKFSEAVKNKSSKHQIRISEKELNSLVAEGKDWLPEQSEIRFKIDDNILANFSISLKDSPLELEYFINGEARVDLILEDCKFQIELLSAKIKDEEASATMLSALNEAISSEQIQKDKQLGEILENIKSVDIREGQIVLESGNCED